MTRPQRIIVGVGVVIVLGLNALLLDQLWAARDENATLRRKITPSLAEQFALYEHSLEGVALAQMAEELAAADGRAASLVDDERRPHLLLYFADEISCRRNLHREAAILKENSDLLRELGIAVTVIFANIKEEDYQTLVRQYDIEQLALLDRSGVLQRHMGPRPGALVMLLDYQNTVLFAQLARASGEEGTRPLYGKIRRIVPGLTRAPATSGKGTEEDARRAR